MGTEGEVTELRLPVLDGYTQDQSFEVLAIAELCHRVRQLLVTALGVIMPP